MNPRTGIRAGVGDGPGIGDKPFVILVNPSAGGGRGGDLLPRAEAAFEERRIAFRVVKTQNGAHAIAEATKAAEAGEIPVVMSGDGLIGMVGGVLAGSGAPLGILPAGRGNDLARVLGIPSDPESAVAVLAKREVTTIDVGDANGVRFLGIASVGFDSEANRIANETRVIRGNLVYAYAALRALSAWKPARFTVDAGSEQVRFTGYSVGAANSKAYGGGMFLAPDADLHDGQLDIVMIGQVGKLRFLGNLPKVFKGTHIEQDEVRVLRTPAIRLTADRPFAVYADGEHITDLPAEIRLLPGALDVIAPPQPA